MLSVGPAFDALTLNTLTRAQATIQAFGDSMPQDLRQINRAGKKCENGHCEQHCLSQGWVSVHRAAHNDNDSRL